MQSSNENTQSRDERKEAKRGRRKFRHEIARRMKRIATKRIGLSATGPQLAAAAKVLTDRYMHQVDHAPTEVAPATPMPPREAEVEASRA